MRGVDALVSRTGYTGEPGVEIIMAAGDAVQVWDGLLEAGAEPIGLGARDTLRLEMCYPLYGNDLDEHHTALEAGLGWACALDAKDFTGAGALRAQRAAGVRSAAGPAHDGRGIPRAGMAVHPAARSPAARSRRPWGSASGWPTSRPVRPLRARARDRRPRPRGSRAGGREAALHQGDRDMTEAVLSRRPALPRGPRLGADRRRHRPPSASRGTPRTRSARSSSSARPRWVRTSPRTGSTESSSRPRRSRR